MKKALALSSTIALIAGTAQAQQPPSAEEMWKIIQQQQEQISQLKAKLESSETRIQETEMKVTATADAVEAIGTEGGAVAGWAEKTTIGGYGEHHYNHYNNAADEDMVDAHRFVLFVGHQFTDNVKFFSELELEHGLSGDGEPGEVELEQAYIQWDYAERHSVKIGQYLIPVGILNETHEPETFYGTERNLVEKNIIPTTWWETGAMLQGEIAPGLSYNAAIHSGLEIEPGDFKVRDGRQKSAKATAEDPAYTLRLKYTGVPGLELAATAQYQSNITQGLAGGDTDATLLEAHAAYRNGPFGLRALWAAWDIDGDLFELVGADEQEGWFVEPSYKVLDNLGLFVRYSEYNNQAGLSSIEDQEIWDYGLNYWLHPRVVFKADYSDNRTEGADSFNLGVGWSF